MISKGLLVLTKTRRGPLRKKVIEAWKAPPLNMVKINWDAALDQQNQVVGLGMIARGEAGCFLSACGIKKRMLVLPVVAEAIAAFHAMLFANNW
jgi:hypothetical protein